MKELWLELTMYPATKRLVHAYNGYLFAWYVEKHMSQHTDLLSEETWKTFYEK